MSHFEIEYFSPAPAGYDPKFEARIAEGTSAYLGRAYVGFI